MLIKLRMNMLQLIVNNLTQKYPAEKNNRGWKLNKKPLMALKRSINEGGRVVYSLNWKHRLRNVMKGSLTFKNRS